MREITVEVPFQKIKVFVPVDADEETVQDAVTCTVMQEVQFVELSE